MELLPLRMLEGPSLMQFSIEPARPDDAPVISQLVEELLQEITAAIGSPVFSFDPVGTENCVRTWLDNRQYTVFLARRTGAGIVVGLLALYESHALYAGGTFGTIPELYVRAGYRSNGVGRRLLEEAKRYARSRGWKRLEVTTPPLPQFDRTFAFYEQQGFGVSGGRKMKADLT